MLIKLWNKILKKGGAIDFTQFNSSLGRSDHHSHSSSTHEDIIELQDVRMSPIASLRNRNYSSGAPENLDLAKFPPSFRITRGTYGTSVN